MTTSRDIRAWSFLAAGLIAAVAPRAVHAADDLAPAIEAVGGGPPARPQRWQLAAGVRTSLVRSAGYDPFSTSDALVMFSTTALWALPAQVTTVGRLTTAVGVSWEIGSSGAVARGADAQLSVMRGGLVLEERFSPSPWGYVFGRLSPAWMSVDASLRDAASPAPLETSRSTFAFDASLGLAAHLNARSRGLGVWLLADGGYGWAPSRDLTLSPALATADADKAGATSLGTLAPRGTFFRGCLALTF